MSGTCDTRSNGRTCALNATFAPAAVHRQWATTEGLKQKYGEEPVLKFKNHCRSSGGFRAQCEIGKDQIKSYEEMDSVKWNRINGDWE